MIKANKTRTSTILNIYLNQILVYKSNFIGFMTTTSCFYHIFGFFIFHIISTVTFCFFIFCTLILCNALSVLFSVLLHFFCIFYHLLFLLYNIRSSQLLSKLLHFPLLANSVLNENIFIITKTVYFATSCGKTFLNCFSNFKF